MGMALTMLGPSKTNYYIEGKGDHINGRGEGESRAHERIRDDLVLLLDAVHKQHPLLVHTGQHHLLLQV